MSLTFTQINPETENATIYLDRMSSLVLTLTPDADITVQSGSNASTFQIYLPDCFSPDDLNIMIIDKTDWTFSSYIDKNNINDCYLSLRYAGDDNYVWVNGDDFTFTIDRICILQTTRDLPYTGSTQINFENFENLSPFTPSYADLTLDNPPPVAGNAHLKEVLQVFLSYEGLIHVSSNEDDPLKNALVLNFNNIGTDPIYTGTQSSNGIVQVSFVYGSTSGALAPLTAGDPPSTTGKGSAWNIEAGMKLVNNENEWSATNPDLGTAVGSPVWQLAPTNNNIGIIDTGTYANISFSFSSIISVTPPGNTQMIVSFSGFMKDDNTPYDETTYILDIIKLDTPKLRGLTCFSVYGEDAVAAAAALRYEVATPQDEINVPLYWGMYYVKKVQIMTSLPGTDPVSFPTLDSFYSDSEAITTDSTNLQLSGIEYSGNISITAQAFDGTGALLNSMELTIFVQTPYTRNLISQSMKGLLRFYSTTPRLMLSDSNNVEIELILRTHGVSRVELYTNYTLLSDPISISCSDTTLTQPANRATITIPQILNRDPITIVAQAFDENSSPLNSMECTVFVTFAYIDQDGKIYPTVQIGSLLWMAVNLDYHTPGGGSQFYNGNASREVPYGRYYKMNAALSDISQGWRLPTQSDWVDLKNHFGGTELLVGGNSGFNAELGGVKYPSWHSLGQEGWYWTQTPSSSGYTLFKIVANGAISFPWLDGSNMLSVRYVRDV